MQGWPYEKVEIHELLFFCIFVGTKRDYGLVVAVEGKLPGKDEDFTQLQTPTVYGLWSVINGKRLYNEIFTCNFNLRMFPFDR